MDLMIEDENISLVDVELRKNPKECCISVYKGGEFVTIINTLATRFKFLREDADGYKIYKLIKI